MTNRWIQQRKEVFERDLIQDFFDAKIYFDKILKAYQRKVMVPFEMLDDWVGSDDKKGPLWLLKDHSHRLFRNGSSHKGLYENLFDWTVGSIFHETIKLKEESYQVESYKPLLELKVKNESYDAQLGDIIQEYFELIERVNNNVKIEIKSISELFSKALYHLHEIIIANCSNRLILHLLLDNEKAAKKVFGREQYKNLLTCMFPDGIHEAYITAAGYYLDGGWHGRAKGYLGKALKMAGDNERARAMLAEIQTLEET